MMEVLTTHGRYEIDADRCTVDGDFLNFNKRRSITIVRQKTIARGIWPFRQYETLDEETETFDREWAMTLRRDDIVWMRPAPAKATETQSAKTPKRGLARKGKGAVGETDLPKPQDGTDQQEQGV